MSKPIESLDELKEQLAAIEHERWADWQKYMHSLCSKLGDFETDYALVIPSNSVTHWERQIATPYSALSRKEQLSDLEQVERYWPILEAYITEREREAYKKGYLDRGVEDILATEKARQSVEAQLQTKEEVDE